MFELDVIDLLSALREVLFKEVVDELTGLLSSIGSESIVNSEVGNVVSKVLHDAIGILILFFQSAVSHASVPVDFQNFTENVKKSCPMLLLFIR